MRGEDGRTGEKKSALWTETTYSIFILHCFPKKARISPKALENQYQLKNSIVSTLLCANNWDSIKTAANKRFCASGADGNAMGICTKPGSGHRATNPAGWSL